MPSLTPNISILLVVGNEDLVARAGLCALLQSWDGVEVVATAANCQAAVELAANLAPDIVLLDFSSDAQTSLDVMAALATNSCPARLIALLSANEPEMHHQAVANGALGLVFREHEPDLLKRAIRHVHGGEVWIDRTTTANALLAMRQIQATPATDPNLSRINTLSEREREIIMLVGEGLKNRDIGSRLFISEATVRNHLSSIFSKLHVSDRLELVVFAYRYELAKLPV